MPTKGLCIEKLNGRIWVDDQLRPGHLSKREVKFLLHLASYQGGLSPRKESVRAVYETEYDPADDQRLDAMVGRIRRKIGDSVQDSRFLITHHAHGHSLQEYTDL